MEELTAELKEKVKKAVREKEIRKVNVKILGISEKTVTAKLHMLKKPRAFFSYRTDDTNDLIIQSKDIVIMPVGHYDSQWTLCLYNRADGGEVLSLHLVFGSKLVLIDRNFVTLMEKLQLPQCEGV